MAMTAEIKGKKLIVTIDIEEPKPSASGKTLSIASSRGNQKTEAKFNGQEVTIGLNAYVKPAK